MKILLSILLVAVNLIKFIESCMKLTGCSWGKDPCNKYTNMAECFKNADCQWGNLDEPPDSPIEVGVKFWNGAEPYVHFKDNNNNNVPLAPPIITCKGRNFESCYFNCAIF